MNDDDDFDYDLPGSDDDPYAVDDVDAEVAAVAATKKVDQQRADDQARADQDRADDERRQDDIRAEDRRREDDQRHEDDLQAMRAAEEQAQAQLEGDALEFGTDEPVDPRREAMEELLEKGRAQNTERAQQREAEAAQADQAEDKGGYYARGYQDIHGNYRSAAEVDAIMRNSKSHTDRQAYLAANGLDTSAGTRARQAELGKTAAESHADAPAAPAPVEPAKAEEDRYAGLSGTDRVHLEAMDRLEQRAGEGAEIASGATAQTDWASALRMDTNGVNAHLEALEKIKTDEAVADFSEGQAVDAHTGMAREDALRLAEAVERANTPEAVEAYESEERTIDWSAELDRADQEAAEREQQRARAQEQQEGGWSI